MQAPRPPARSGSQIGEPAVQPGAMPLVVGRQFLHTPLPPLAAGSQKVPAAQPAVVVQVRQRLAGWLQMGSATVHPGSMPASPAAMQVRQKPPVTVVSQTRPLPQ